MLAPTLQSWWVLNELPEPARAPLRALGLAAWLPFPLAPLIEVMEQLGRDPFSVIVSFPDITGPVLRGMGHDIGCGLGNVSEVAAKFPRPVRLVAHHSLGPHAFGSYGSSAASCRRTSSTCPRTRPTRSSARRGRFTPTGT